MFDRLAALTRNRGLTSWAEGNSDSAIFLLLFFALLGSGCHHQPLIDTTPLDSAGMNYDAIQQLKALNITPAEVPELAKARRGGLPDALCIEALRSFHARRQPFNAGGAAAGLIEAGMRPETVVALAELNQLGIDFGELQAMRLAGISDDTILEIARHRAEGKPALSGASLAGMKNAGVRDNTLLELARRSIPDSQAAKIIALRRRGASDAEILRYFTGS
jgi:hypothetical protein